MSSESLNSVFSDLHLPYDCPVKLKKIIDECSNPNEVLDNLLKVLGDISNEPHLANVILEMIPKICSESEIQLSEIEFAILSFQNIYNINLFKTDVKHKLLEVFVTVLLSYQLSQEVTDDCVQFLLSILENKSEPAFTCLSSLDCLLEIELSKPETLKEKIQIFVMMLNHELYKNKASEITSLIIRNTTDPVENQPEILRALLENLSTLCPLTMATVTKNILNLCEGSDFQFDLERSLEKLMFRYKNTFDLCILQTITSIQERCGGITNENSAFVSSTHPALPVGSNLIALDWLASSVHINDKLVEVNRFEPTYFDGADVRLKKILFLSKTSLHQSLDPALFRHHFEKLISFAVKNATSRAFAAVFRVMRNMIESKFPTDAVQIVITSTVELGARHPASLPHIVDFLKHLGANRPDQSSEAITLGLIDAFDEMETTLMVPHFEQLIQFFTESTIYQYEFCQPRMMLHVISNCLSKDKKIKNSSCGAAVLELCQALIRNQDYEIFQPELKTLLSLIETSQEESDIKQRAWMLRSLITHVNTESLKDAFDVDMDLSSTGKVVNADYPLISLEVLFDYNVTDTMSVTWSLERKRSCRSFYFPLEVRLAENEKSSYQEYFGIQVDFIVDAKWGRVESLYIPVLEVNQVKKACLQLLPLICSATTIEARVIMSTTDGRIYVSNLEPIHLKLEHLLSPLSSSKSFTELWDQLTSQSEKCYSSALYLPRPEKLLQAVEQGKLDRFQMSKKKPTELAMVMVTPDSFLVLVQILSVKNSWHAEILVENPSVLPVVKSLLAEYST